MVVYYREKYVRSFTDKIDEVYKMYFDDNYSKSYYFSDPMYKELFSNANVDQYVIIKCYYICEEDGNRTMKMDRKIVSKNTYFRKNKF